MEDFGDRILIMIVFVSIAFGFYNRTGDFTPFFLVFFLFFLDNIRHMITLRMSYQLGVDISQDQMRKVREKVKKNRLSKLFFNLIYLRESLLFFIFAKIHLFVLGILFDKILIAFFFMTVTGFIYVIAMGYVILDFARKKPNLLVVRLIKEM